jgi:hypothetical protein
MLVRPHDCGIDGMFFVGGRPERSQRLEDCIPYAELAPAGEAHEDRVPIAVSLGHVAPRRASAQNPQNAVGRSPLVRDGWTTFAPIRQQWIENAPFRVRQIAPTQCCLLQKGSLESKLDSSVKNRQHALVLSLMYKSGFDPTVDVGLPHSFNGGHYRRAGQDVVKDASSLAPAQPVP